MLHTMPNCPKKAKKRLQFLCYHSNGMCQHRAARRRISQTRWRPHRHRWLLWDTSDLATELSRQPVDWNSRRMRLTHPATSPWQHSFRHHFVFLSVF